MCSPDQDILGGMRVDQLQVGRTYDLPTRVARALIAEGYAHEERRSENRRGKKNKQKAALLSARRGDVVDVLERVLTKGVVFDIEEGTVGASEAGGGAKRGFASPSQAWTCSYRGGTCLRRRRNKRKNRSRRVSTGVWTLFGQWLCRSLSTTESLVSARARTNARFGQPIVVSRDGAILISPKANTRQNDSS